MSLAYKIYYALPPGLRTLPASARGYYLRSWRYGGKTQILVSEALERETWSRRQWDEWSSEQLYRALHHAATQVPFYREMWAKRGRSGGRDWEDLCNWPVLTKDALRATPEAFVADDHQSQKLFTVNTSGTSGKPLTLRRSKEASMMWHALFEARWRRWNGVSLDDRWAIFGGQLVVPFSQQKPPFWVWNAGMRQLYLSTFHLAPNFVADYVEALRKYRVAYLWGYASSLYALAQMIEEQGLQAPSMRVALSNAEPLHPFQREVIARVFSCPARDTYGMAEMVAGASECAEGRMHLWPEVGKLEVLADEGDEPLDAGRTGRFVCTQIINPAMPLIRYEVGDRGSLAPLGDSCACGRTMPLLQSIEGRMNDMLVTPDGRRIFWINPVFYGLPLREAQVIQESVERLRVRYVPVQGADSAVAEEIGKRLRQRVGGMEILVEPVESIPRGPNGKFRGVINQVTSSQPATG